MSKAKNVKNALFALLGVIALANSLRPEINRETEFCLMLQFFAFVMLIIGICGLFEAYGGNGKKKR